jgi:hypothetical protein
VSSPVSSQESVAVPTSGRKKWFCNQEHAFRFQDAVDFSERILRCDVVHVM